MTVIKILSASDRFNYGDLLFPIITIKELAKHGDFTFQNVGLVKSDLKDIGALPTHSYKKLYQKDKTGKSIILVAGGDVFSVNWSAAYSYLNPFYHKLYWRLYTYPMFEKVTRRILGYSKIVNPFIPSDKEIINKNLIIFNGVGGYPAFNHSNIETLKKAIYLSVREKGTYEYMKNGIKNLNVAISPDSAILMSDYYSFDASDENYIAFQMGHYTLELPLVVKELERVYRDTGYKIVLIPIGNCIGHYDIKSLSYISQQADFPCEILRKPNIRSIMGAIAKAKFFLGTSLHGTITAMSFSVPYAGMNPKIIKLKNYLKCWAPDVMNEIIPFESISKTVRERISYDQRKLKENAEYQKGEARKSFHKIAELISEKQIQ